MGGGSTLRDKCINMSFLGPDIKAANCEKKNRC